MGLIVGLLVYPYAFRDRMMHDHSNMHVSEHRDELISHKVAIQNNLISSGDYACCLAQPCTYCIEKTPGHGEGASCSCLDDVVNGLHPCGECIGEIMEGHGNPFLAKYFAKAIAEEVGEQHIDTLREIIEDKYELPVAEQI